MNDIDIDALPVLDYPPFTEDLEEAKAQIDEYGMALISNVTTPAETDVIDRRLAEQWAGEEARDLGTIMRGDEGFGGEVAKEDKVSRLVWNLINKGDCFLPLIDHPKILPLIQHMLGEKVLLGSMGAHMNGSGNEQMPLHQDQWPLIPEHMPYSVWCNSILFVTDNSPENGGTRLIPGSHKWPDLKSGFVNYNGQHLAKSVTAPRGSAVVWDGRVWHGNGLNRSGQVRANISIAYARPWIRPQENHQYSLRPEVFDKLTERQKEILGFTSFGSLGGHDGSSVSPADFDPSRVSIGELHG